MVSSLREQAAQLYDDESGGDDDDDDGGAGAASGRTCNAGEEMPCDPAANGRAMASI